MWKHLWRNRFLIEHLQLGKLGGIIFKGEPAQKESAKAATRTLVRKLRITLNEILNTLDKFSTQVYLSKGLKYFSEGYNEEKVPKKISISEKREIHVNGITFGSLIRVKWCEVLTKRSDISIHPYIHRKQLDDLISQRRKPEVPPWRIETPQIPVELSDDVVVVHGREEDKRKVIELLLSDPRNSSCPQEDIHVMSIVGGCGVGKTTLAKLVYNDHRIGNSFDMIMWVSMSNRYSDIIRTTISFAEAAGGEEATLSLVAAIVGEAADRGNRLALDLLRLILHKLLRGKKFLLILDGVSNEICRDWEVLRIPFHVGTSNGSKILITTMSSMVSSRLGTFSYTLVTLLHEDCSSLVRQLTFEGGKCRTATEALPPPPPLGLSELIEEMTELLKGLPSIAAALGFYLHSVPHKEKLQRASKVISSYYVHTSWSPFSSTMLWTYHRLSSLQLKLCFVYFGLFSKGYMFKKPQLIMLWMAEGFLQTTKGSGMMMEDVGLSYFEELFE